MCNLEEALMARLIASVVVVWLYSSQANNVR